MTIITQKENLANKHIQACMVIMAVFYKDWELLNSRIWLAEIDTESGLVFPI